MVATARRALLFGALGTLAGCAGRGGACAPGGGNPVPLTLDGDRAYVLARVNGRPVSLLLDTGAQRSLLATDAIAPLGLAADPVNVTRTLTVGGAVVRMPNALVPVFELGRTRYARISMPVAPFSEPGRREPPVAGILGADLLAEHVVELAPAQGTMLLHPPGCTPPGAATPVEVQRGLILLPVTVDGVALRAILDSGASASIMTTDAAARLGVTAAMLAHDPAVTSRGMDLRPIRTAMHRFREMRVGAETMREPVIAVAEIRLAGADMLLGMDWLAPRHVWLAIAQGRMVV